MCRGTTPSSSVRIPIAIRGAFLARSWVREIVSVPRHGRTLIEPVPEFLLAAGEDGLVRFLRDFAPPDAVAGAIHARLMARMREFLVIGGMPEVVAAHVSDQSPRECDMIKESILSTYRDDFGRYGRRVRHDRLVKVFRELPRLVGSRLKYVRIDPHERAKDLDRALRQLCLARVAHRIHHSSGNGVPLAAEANERKSKILYLDVGLMVRELGLNLLDIERAQDLLLVDEGAVCEQLVGQHLLYSREEYEEPELHFWAREKPNSTAEVDYLIAAGAEIVPIEVKAGKTGTLKSLQLFLREKGRCLGVRLNSAPPSLLDAETCLPGGGNVPFRLLSLPLYLVGQVRRLARAARG